MTEIPIYDCYCNLHRGGLSLLNTSGKRYGRLAGHAENVRISNAVFRIQKGGRERAVREGKRNVHAYVRGQVEVDLPVEEFNEQVCQGVRIHYRPFDKPAFFREDTGESLVGAGKVIIIGKTAYAIDPITQT